MTKHAEVTNAFTRTAVRALVASAASLAMLAPPAQAAENVQAVDAAETQRHWTAERINQVVGLELPLGDGRGQTGGSGVRPGGRPQAVGAPARRSAIVAPRKGRRGRPGGTRSSAIRPRHPNAPITNWSSHGYGTARAAIPAAGRIFFTSGGRNNVCSGTLVQRNIVMTASHCLRNPGRAGAWSANVAFAPGVYGASRPYGTFAARRLVVTNEWVASGDYSMDYAFIVLSPNAAGYHAGDYAGTFPILLNAPGGSMYEFGYPAEGPWLTSCTTAFCRPQYCNSPIQRYNRYASGHYDVGMSCHIAGGASGGPMFKHYNGRWYVASVVSHGAWMRLTANGREGFDVYGPYLDGSVNNYLAYAQRL